MKKYNSNQKWESSKKFKYNSRKMSRESLTILNKNRKLKFARFETSKILFKKLKNENIKIVQKNETRTFTNEKKKK